MTFAHLPGGSSSSAAAVPPVSRRQPRNFLSATEQRKLFWRFMPPAVVLVVVIELLARHEPPPRPPGEPQVDTRIEAVAGPPPAEDEVIILPADEPPPESDDQARRAASPQALAGVRDATFFRQADRDAWLEIFLAVQGREGRHLQPPQDVGFTELFGQPEAFRGRPVRIRGTLRRLERLTAPRNDYGVDAYWQGWLEPADGPASPVIIHCLELPPGMASGMEIDEPAVVAGVFLKNMAYRAADGVRVAPLILARSPARPPRPAERPGDRIWDRSLAAVGVVTMLAFVAVIGIGFLASGRGGRRPPAAAGLDASLADLEPVSIAESLRRVAAEEADDMEPSDHEGGRGV